MDQKSMPATATVRDLRTRFPAIKMMLRKEGRVTITDHGKAVAVLTPAPSDEEDPERIRVRKELKAALKNCNPAEFDRPLPDEFQGMCG
jgi:antitoxin (DNA-binding transcriptional repressor) of toxin-antitoxin stability system